MRGGRRQQWALGGVLGATAVLCVVGFALVLPTSAAGLSATDAALATSGPVLVLSGDAPGTVHELMPGAAVPWNVGVTVRGMPVSTLVGIVAAEGGFGADDTAVPATIEVRGCADAWAAMTCASGEREILPATSIADLTDARLALADPSKPIPAQVWVQARVTLAANAPQSTTGRLVVRLTVDATGADSGGGASSGAGSLGGGSSSVADTGSSVIGPALMALAALAAGLALVGLVRGRRRHG